MKIASVLENQNLEKRIAITPELVKKYTSIGFEVNLIENYGSHLGIKDNQFKDVGVKILKDEIEILSCSALFFASLLGLTLNAITTAFEAFAKVTSVSVTIPISDRSIFGFTSSCLI